MCHGNAELWNTRYTSCNMLCKANASFFVKTLNYVVKCCIVSYTCIVFNKCKNLRVSLSSYMFYMFYINTVVKPLHVHLSLLQKHNYKKYMFITYKSYMIRVV